MLGPTPPLWGLLRHFDGIRPPAAVTYRRHTFLRTCIGPIFSFCFIFLPISSFICGCLLVLVEKNTGASEDSVLPCSSYTQLLSDLTSPHGFNSQLDLQTTKCIVLALISLYDLLSQHLLYVHRYINSNMAHAEFFMTHPLPSTCTSPAFPISANDNTVHQLVHTKSQGFILDSSPYPILSICKS